MMNDEFRTFVHHLSFIIHYSSFIVHGCHFRDLPSDSVAQANYFALADTLAVNGQGPADAYAGVIPAHGLGAGRVSSFRFRVSSFEFRVSTFQSRISRAFEGLPAIANPDGIYRR